MVTVTGPITFIKGGDWGLIYSTASGITLPFKATTWSSTRYTDAVSTNTYAVDPNESRPTVPMPTPEPSPPPAPIIEEVKQDQGVVEEVVPEEPHKIEMTHRRRKVK